MKIKIILSQLVYLNSSLGGSYIGPILVDYWPNIGQILGIHKKILNIGPIIIQYWTNLASVRPPRLGTPYWLEICPILDIYLLLKYQISNIGPINLQYLSNIGDF